MFCKNKDGYKIGNNCSFVCFMIFWSKRKGKLSRKETVHMGIYLNSVSPYTLYKSEVCSPYFVDKSQMLRELIPLAESDLQYPDYHTSCKSECNRSCTYHFWYWFW